MATKKITDLTQLTDLDATDSFVVNDSGAGADKRVEFSDLQSEVLNGAAIGTSTAITELQVDNLNLNGNTFSSTDTNGNVIIQPNGTGATIINESGAASDFRVEGDTDTDLLFVDASTDRVGISTNAPGSTLDVAGTLAVSGDANFDSGTLFVDVSENKVGIGTTSPTFDLSIDKNAEVILHLRSGDSNIAGILFGDQSDLSGGSLYYNNSNDSMEFRVNNQLEVMQVTSDKYLRMVSGTGGIQFGGDTAAANALDDYEEGSWTPTIIGSTSAGTASYSAQIGKYTKIGNKVTCEAQLTYSGHTGTGNMYVTLPTTVVNSTNYYASASIGYCNNISLTAGNVITCFATSNLNYVSFYQYPTGGGASTAVPVDAAGAIFFSITYESQ